MKYFNAHCHLELSHLKGRIPQGLPFTEWIGKLTKLKGSSSHEESRVASLHTLRRMLDTNTTVLADILSLCTSEEPIRDVLLCYPWFRTILFWEMIEFDELRGQSAVNRCIGRQPSSGPLPPTSMHGLSPHAPYTTTGTLLRAAALTARNRGQWLCIHAAETAEETELMLHSRGPLRDLLHEVVPAVREGKWQPPAMRPIAWLDACNCLGPRTLLVHCNDINDDDIRRIRMRRASVVVCPGSHIYFGRGEFPLERLLAAGIPVFLGTDSLASNEDVDMAREVALAAELSPSVTRESIEQLASADRAMHFFGSRQLESP